MLVVVVDQTGRDGFKIEEIVYMWREECFSIVINTLLLKCCLVHSSVIYVSVN